MATELCTEFEGEKIHEINPSSMAAELCTEFEGEKIHEIDPIFYILLVGGPVKSFKV